MGGCVTAKTRNIPPDFLVNPAIQQEEQIPTHKFSVTSTACGYGFGIDQSELELIRNQQKLKIKQIELDKFNELSLQYQNLIIAYKNHKIDRAVQIINRVTPLFQSINFSLIQQIEQKQRQEILDFVTTIKEQYKELLIFENEMKKGGWVHKHNNNGIDVSSRREDDTVAVLVEAIIEVPVQIFLTVASEMDLYKDIAPFMEESTLEKVIDRNNKIGYCTINFPLISKRQAYFQGIGYNRLLHDKTIFLYSRSLHNRPDLCKKLQYKRELAPNFVQMDYKYLIIKYQPIDFRRGKVCLAMNIDMKINFVPISILDYSCQSFGEGFFLNLVEISKNFKGSVWEKKIIQNPDGFNFFKSCVEQYFQQKQEK